MDLRQGGCEWKGRVVRQGGRKESGRQGRWKGGREDGGKGGGHATSLEKCESCPACIKCYVEWVRFGPPVPDDQEEWFL